MTDLEALKPTLDHDREIEEKVSEDEDHVEVKSNLTILIMNQVRKLLFIFLNARHS